MPAIPRALRVLDCHLRTDGRTSASRITPTFYWAVLPPAPLPIPPTARHTHHTTTHHRHHARVPACQAYYAMPGIRPHLLRHVPPPRRTIPSTGRTTAAAATGPPPDFAVRKWLEGQTTLRAPWHAPPYSLLRTDGRTDGRAGKPATAVLLPGRLPCRTTYRHTYPPNAAWTGQVWTIPPPPTVPNPTLPQFYHRALGLPHGAVRPTCQQQPAQLFSMYTTPATTPTLQTTPWRTMPSASWLPLVACRQYRTTILPVPYVWPSTHFTLWFGQDSYPTSPNAHHLPASLPTHRGPSGQCPHPHLQTTLPSGLRHCQPPRHDHPHHAQTWRHHCHPTETGLPALGPAHFPLLQACHHPRPTVPTPPNRTPGFGRLYLLDGRFQPHACPPATHLAGMPPPCPTLLPSPTTTPPPRTDTTTPCKLPPCGSANMVLGQRTTTYLPH